MSILHPTSDGEDFIYDLMSEYLRNHFHVSNDEIIGHKYSEVFYLFAHNLRILDLMKKLTLIMKELIISMQFLLMGN